MMTVATTSVSVSLASNSKIAHGLTALRAEREALREQLKKMQLESKIYLFNNEFKYNREFLK